MDDTQVIDRSAVDTGSIHSEVDRSDHSFERPGDRSESIRDDIRDAAREHGHAFAESEDAPDEHQVRRRERRQPERAGRAQRPARL